MTRVLVCGGRDFADAKSLYNALDMLHLTVGVDVVIHGCARGADTFAGRWARENRVTEERFPADWETHGRAAGHIRNRHMLLEGKPDMVLAAPGGVGTENMVQQAEKAGVRVDRVK